ncbi:MAG: HAMP domain-containing protein, partial [Chloroflexota bacterium]
MKLPNLFRVNSRKFNTLRFRLAFWISALLAVVVSVFSVLVYFSLSAGMLSAIDESLLFNTSQSLLSIEVENNFLDLPDRFEESPDSEDIVSKGLTLRLLSPELEVLWAAGSFHSLPTIPDTYSFSNDDDILFETSFFPQSGQKIRIATSPIMNNDRLIGILQVIQTLELVEESLNRLLLIFLITLPIIVFVAGAGGYYLSGRALGPINHITSVAANISEDDLSARIDPPKTYDEVGRLAASFNSMLERIENAFQRERQFTADASHELRTPLSAILTIHNVIRQKERTRDEYERALDDISEEASRLQGLTENLLFFARTDKVWKLDFQPINL